jgi:hypothetical protein
MTWIRFICLLLSLLYSSCLLGEGFMLGLLYYCYLNYHYSNYIYLNYWYSNYCYLNYCYRNCNYNQNMLIIVFCYFCYLDYYYYSNIDYYYYYYFDNNNYFYFYYHFYYHYYYHYYYYLESNTTIYITFISIVMIFNNSKIIDFIFLFGKNILVRSGISQKRFMRSD